MPIFFKYAQSLATYPDNKAAIRTLCHAGADEALRYRLKGSSQIHFAICIADLGDVGENDFKELWRTHATQKINALSKLIQYGRDTALYLTLYLSV